MYKVIIRADGSPNIGMGHIMRCISLGKMFFKKDYEVAFVSKYKEGQKEISANGFDIIPLYMDVKKDDNQLTINYGTSDDLEGEKQVLMDILKSRMTNILIIDHYNITKEFLLSLKPYVNMLIYIDDICMFTYPVDIVINGNITGEDMNYQSHLDNQKFLLGPSYNLIRDEFKYIPKRNILKKVRKILITTGGADPYCTTEKLLNIIRNEIVLDEIELHVIIGASFQNQNTINEIKNKCSNIIIHKNVKKISEIMIECDIAISSCGSTLYELCACGTPTLGFILANNQVLVAEKMHELGYIINLGWHHQFIKNVIIHQIKELICDFGLRKQMAKQQQCLVDGKGTERILNVITKMMKEKEGVTYQ